MNVYAWLIVINNFVNVKQMFKTNNYVTIILINKCICIGNSNK